MCIEYVWKIIPKETPIVEKNCTRCHHNKFICSDKFRINSNKKMSDVWLIYKCAYCESTWNMSIFARINLSRIDKDLFCQFQDNNVQLAWKYAFDKSIAKTNKARMNGNVEFDIIDRKEDLFLSNQKIISVLITSEYQLSISIKKIIQQKFNFSASQVDKMHKEKIIVIDGEINQDISKKIGFGCRLSIDIENWKYFDKD